jgi:hypothetical protein
MTGPRVWRMCAAWRRGPGGVAVLANFGDERYVRFYGQEPVPVELIEDPAGAFWGWIDAKSGSGEPVMVQSHEKLFRVQFPYGPEVEVERGKGEIVRLSCREVPDA